MAQNKPTGLTSSLSETDLFPIPAKSANKTPKNHFVPPNKTTTATEVMDKMEQQDAAAEPQLPKQGRGSLINPVNRYEMIAYQKEDDGWNSLAAEPQAIATQYIKDTTRTIINYVASPDLPFDRTINPYRGCEHGCVYCYARPSHAYLGFSPGLDFETKIVYKPNAAELLHKELNAKKYHCAPIMIGANTDPYQQAERRFKITRSILEVLQEAQHPCALITKSGLASRDLDILTLMAQKQLVQVFVSITTLNTELVNRMEPRTAAPARRLALVKELAEAGVPVGVMVAPIIPFINDSEMETIMDEAATRGARTLSYVFLRLPYELKEIFASWLKHHYPEQAKRVLARIIDSRDGRLYDSAYHQRMRGKGVFADLISARFKRKYRSLSLPGLPSLSTRGFQPPPTELKKQYELF